MKGVGNAFVLLSVSQGKTTLSWKGIEEKSDEQAAEEEGGRVEIKRKMVPSTPRSIGF